MGVALCMICTAEGKTFILIPASPHGLLNSSNLQIHNTNYNVAGFENYSWRYQSPEVPPNAVPSQIISSMDNNLLHEHQTCPHRFLTADAGHEGHAEQQEPALTECRVHWGKLGHQPWTYQGS